MHFGIDTEHFRGTTAYLVEMGLPKPGENRRHNPDATVSPVEVDCDSFDGTRGAECLIKGSCRLVEMISVTRKLGLSRQLDPSPPRRQASAVVASTLSTRIVAGHIQFPTQTSTWLLMVQSKVCDNESNRRQYLDIHLQGARRENWAEKEVGRWH